MPIEDVGSHPRGSGEIMTGGGYPEVGQDPGRTQHDRHEEKALQ